MYDTWYTSDTHFYHKGALKYRPYDSLEEMNEILIQNWNKLVKPKDVIWHNGDFAFCGAKKLYELVGRLNGHKKLVMGNHDWVTKLSRLQRAGFEEIITEHHITSVSNEVCYGSHYPYYPPFKELVKMWFKGCNIKNLKMRLRDNGWWLLHGHVHDEWKVKDNMINLGVDVWDQKPVHTDEILKIMQV